MLSAYLAAGSVLATASVASAGSPPFFIPLTESAPVTAANSVEELNAPWIAPLGVRQENLTSMSEIEADPAQSVGRAPDVSVPGSGEQDVRAGSSQSMWDMSAFDPTGRFVFIPHESPWSAGLTRYDTVKDEATLLWRGDSRGALGDWSNDFGAFDPAFFTPNCTVFVAEEWTGEGRLMETLNPFADPDKMQVRELQSIANVAHEGMQFSADQKSFYYIDEWNSGSIYKFVMTKKGDYTRGQTFVLSVDAFNGDPAADWNRQPDGTERTGLATWVPITDEHGNPLTTVDPFRNGPTNDPRTNDNTRGGRPAADEVNGTPYGRPEDLEIARLRNGHEVVYFTATSERAVYSIEELGGDKATVRLFASDAVTPKNLGFAPTTAALNSPDNLAQDALGNLYIIEDAPNGSSTGGDVWFVRDENNDGVAESIDHFLSLRVAGSEATGMIFNPANPLQFIISVMHPDTTDLDQHPGGFGDSLWQFDLRHTQAPCAEGKRCARVNPGVLQLAWAGVKDRLKNLPQTLRCHRAMRAQMRD
jgi:hypothetical protein